MTDKEDLKNRIDKMTRTEVIEIIQSKAKPNPSFASTGGMRDEVIIEVKRGPA